MTPNFFQAATLKKIWVEATLKKNLRWHPIKIWVDFTGYPSNHFSGCRLNGRLFKNGTKVKISSQINPPENIGSS